MTQENFHAAGPQRLVATKVPAGTWVTIQFWAVKGYPGIGNVTIEVHPHLNARQHHYSRGGIAGAESC